MWAYSMNIPRRGSSTLPQLMARYNCSRSFLYEEKARGRLKISNAGKKALVFDEDEDEWRELCRTSTPTASDTILEELGASQDWDDVLDITTRFVTAIAKMPARKRERLIEHFNDLVTERAPNK